MAEPTPATNGTAVPEHHSDVDAVIATFGGDARGALAAALDDIAFLRCEIEFARLAMSYGFARGWRPSVERPAEQTGD